MSRIFLQKRSIRSLLASIAVFLAALIAVQAVLWAIGSVFGDSIESLNKAVEETLEELRPMKIGARYWQSVVALYPDASNRMSIQKECHSQNIDDHRCELIQKSLGDWIAYKGRHIGSRLESEIAIGSTCRNQGLTEKECGLLRNRVERYNIYREHWFVSLYRKITYIINIPISLFAGFLFLLGEIFDEAISQPARGIIDLVQIAVGFSGATWLARKWEMFDQAALDHWGLLTFQCVLFAFLFVFLHIDNVVSAAGHCLARELGPEWTDS